MLENAKRRLGEDVLDNKAQYLLVVFFLVVGITAGTFTVGNMHTTTRDALGGFAGALFSSVKTQTPDYWRVFFNAFFFNTLVFALLAFFSMMTIGVLLNALVLLIKGFLAGFAVGVLSLGFDGGGVFAAVVCLGLPNAVLLPCVCKAGVLCFNQSITVFKNRRIPSTTRDRLVGAAPHFRKLFGVYMASLLGVLIQTLLTPALMRLL